MNAYGPRVAEAIAHLERGRDTGHADEFRKAQSIVRKLEQEASETPEERARRVRLAAAKKAEQALAGPAAAYSRYLAKKGKAA